MADEFERIARLTRRFRAPPAPARGIGDDAALIPPTGATTVVTVDASVEGVHFSRDLVSLAEAAERAVEAAMSDIAAMGATLAWGARGGTGIVSAITAPATLEDWDFDALIDGVARAADRAGTYVLGGNLSLAPVVSLTTTVLGRLDGRALLRSGARVGDKLCVTGVVGAAALGLRALGSHAHDDRAFAPFVRAWRAPRARLSEGVLVAGFASAAIDISDGLAQDAGHIAQASDAGIVIDVDRLPMLPGQSDAATLLGADAVQLALGGGEDYELLFTAADVPPAPSDSAGWTVIGEVIASRGVFVRDARGMRPYEGHGWSHFRDL